jgi:hypothetical protein
MSRKKTSRTGQTVKNLKGTATRQSPKTGRFDQATEKRVKAAEKAVTAANKRALMRAAGKMIPGAGVAVLAKDALDVATDLIPAESFKNIEEMERTPRARMKRTERSVSPPGDPLTLQEGGMIPPEKKGFNMLSEEVQRKIDRELANEFPKPITEFMHGGEVHAPSENVSRGTRAAIKGKKFSGVY